jgi:hypothetical protein
MVALKNLTSKLAIIRKVRYTAEEETVLGNIVSNVEKSLKYAIGKLNYNLCSFFFLRMRVQMEVSVTKYSLK